MQEDCSIEQLLGHNNPGVPSGKVGADVDAMFASPPE
jgi:hypothetical protein